MRRDFDYPDRRKDSWGRVLIALSLVYLVFELAFNARLLEVTGTLSSIADVHHIEIEGRMISAAGLTLIALSWIVHRMARGKSLGAALMMITAVSLISAPAMFFGEKKLVDSLARMADAQVRQHAMDLIILKKGLAEGAATIRGVPYRSTRPTPVDKTFLALSGVMVFGNPPFINQVVHHRRQILENTAQAMAIRSTATYYRRYLGAARKVHRDYDRYYAASRQVLEAEANAPAMAQEAWLKANTRMLSAYRQYQASWATVNRGLPSEARRITPKLREFFDYRNSCFTSGCRTEVDATYRKEAGAALHTAAPPWTYWCDSVYRKAHRIKIASGYINGKYTPTYLSWGKQVKTDRYVCPTTPQSVLKRLGPLAARVFQRKAGIAPGLSLAQFMASGIVRRRFIRQARAMGVALPDEWQVNDEQTFFDLAGAAIRAQTLARYRRSITAAAGVYLPPGLTRAQFDALPVVQHQATRQISWCRAGAVSFHMSEARFQSEALLPRARLLGEQALQRVRTQGSALGEGQRYAKAGRRYMKDVLVPPIALCLSLFFGLLNAFNAGGKILFGVTGLHAYKKLRTAFTGLSISLVLAGPFVFANRIDNSAAYHRLFAEMRKDSGVFAWPVAWAMHAEPIIYPAGANLARAMRWAYAHLTSSPP